MTIGANQAFAQSNTGGPNDTGKQERPDPPDSDNDPGDDDDDDGDDPLRPINRLTLVPPCGTAAAVIDCPPPRRRKPKVVEVKEKTEDCGCVHKVMRVNGRFMPFIDCYNTVLINGREQLRYCRKD